MTDFGKEIARMIYDETNTDWATAHVLAERILSKCAKEIQPPLPVPEAFGAS